jgi:PEP-CTERM motif
MRRRLTRLALWLFTVGSFSAMASASSIPVGLVSYDVTSTGFAQFDVTNQSGPNSSTFPDTTWPVTTSVSLTSLSLTVDFTTGTSETFGSGFFTLEPDGLSYTGPVLPTSETVATATLTGDLSPTVFTLNNGSSAKVLAGFTATITDSSGTLADGDFTVINARVVPEPATWLLMASGLAVLLLAWRRLSLAG